MRQVQTLLIHAAGDGRAADVAALLADGADVNERNAYGWTALWVACAEGHTHTVAKLLAANADVNLAANATDEFPINGGMTPLYIACQEGHIEVVTKLLAANADVNQAKDNGATPLQIACHQGHLGVVQLLSSYSASRSFPFAAPYDTAEHFATAFGRHDVVAWLVRTRLWSTALHHLELLTPERALALLRADADIHAAAEPGGPTPLSLAQALATAGAAAEGTAAFLVLEAAKPWSRKTHKYFPAAARARAVELWPWGFRFSQQFTREEQAMFDVWMTVVMPHEVTRDYKPPPPPPPPPPRRSARVAGRGS